MLDLPEDTSLRVESVQTSARGTAMRFSYNAPMPLEGKELAAAAGVRVDVNGAGALEFDRDGKLVRAHAQPNDPRALEAMRDHVRKLVATDQIYFAQTGEAIDLNKLRAAGKPWYVQTDQKGLRRLKRAYMA